MVKNPKPEAPKPEGNPKSEIRNPHPFPHSVRSLRDPEAPVPSRLRAGPTPEGSAISVVGFRISAFGFPSDFGLRISDFLPGLRNSEFLTRCVLTALFLFLPANPALCAGAQPGRPADPYMSLLMSQPKTEIASNVVAVASFDPPFVRPGEAAVYRVSLNALEESIVWPEKLNAPAELGFRAGGHGQILPFNGTNFVPRTTFNYHLRAPRLGAFTAPEFTATVYGKPVTVPAARLYVVASPPASMPPAPALVFEVPETNLYAGQAVKVRLLLGPSPAGQLQTLMQVQINGEGVLVDQGAAHQQVGPVRRGAGTVAAYIYETVLTPLRSGKLTVFAQGYSAGNRYFGPLIGASGPGPVPNNLPQFTLLDSEPVELQVRPLPRHGELPGFTGAIGSFSLEPPRLAADPLRAGETVRLSVTVRGDGNVGRLAAPPPPQVTDWQVFAATPEPLPPASPLALLTRQPPVAHGSTTFVYTLVPLTTAAQATPAIPFSYFDPKRDAYVDLTIPAVPVTIQPGEKGADLRVLEQPDQAPAESEKEPGLSGLAPGPGIAAATLAPVQRRPWFPLVQLAPAAAFVGLWGWDRRRRFLEQHPEVLLRRRARRALRRQWRALRRAARAGDAPGFAEAAVAAMQAACAPHYPAEPRALVGADVLPLLSCAEAPPEGGQPEAPRDGMGPDTNERAIETQRSACAEASAGRREERREDLAGRAAAAVARRFFVLTDAARFGPDGADATELLALQPELEKALQLMERRL
jgi:hypothetical protein